MRTFALLLSFISLSIGSLTLLHHTSSRTLPLALPKFLASTFAPWIALIGGAGATLGVISGSWTAVAVGLIGGLFSADYVRQVAARHDESFHRVFGAGWGQHIAPEAESRMLRSRWGWFIPSSPQARVSRDIAYATIPGSERALLCDVWRPPARIAPSGTAVVYLHGSAWFLMDKDFLTRPFFRHLAAQGHVVMDVAYRLCPETNAVGMVGDAKRAVAWIKQNAEQFGVDRDRVVLAGASAGAHVALLAAYSEAEPSLTPEDLLAVDTSVQAVVSYYGVPDLRAFERHANRMTPPGETREQPAAPRPEPGRFENFMMRLTMGRTLTARQMPPPPSHVRILQELVGGMPCEVPEMYDLASPICHVCESSPPTLLFHGAHDFLVPVASARELFHALESHRVPTVYIEYPRTDHAFDIMYPPLIGPAGQAALYDMERFLACLASLPRKRNEALLPDLSAHAPGATLSKA